MTFFNKHFSARKTNPTTTVILKDLGELLAPIIYDARQNNTEAPKTISNALDEVRDLLSEGFKHESHKGQLYYALYNALTIISEKVKACDQDIATEIKLENNVLSLLKTSYCQLGEAAIQYGGSKNINPSLRWLFSNNGDGHGPKDKKYKSQLLNEIVNNTALVFFKKYAVELMSDEALEFYDAPTPQQRLM
jgi:hypothetical protein